MPAVKQPLQLLHAYRDLYRAGLKSVQYARPARFEIRDILRVTFRESPPSHFNQRRVDNTIQFLANAQNMMDMSIAS